MLRDAQKVFPLNYVFANLYFRLRKYIVIKTNIILQKQKNKKMLNFLKNLFFGDEDYQHEKEMEKKRKDLKDWKGTTAYGSTREFTQKEMQEGREQNDKLVEYFKNGGSPQWK